MTLPLLLASVLTLVQYNCENLFDTSHDEGFNDYEYLPTSDRKWDGPKYWRKLNDVAKAIVACGGEGEAWALPDMVVLCEVENDSVMRDLTRRSSLREAHYEYIVTQSSDERGIDVALLYSPFSFAPRETRSLRVPRVEGRHDTRDVLYAKGLLVSGDTLHLLALHAPSRIGGKAAQRQRDALARLVATTADSIAGASPGSCIVVAGDFNDYETGTMVQQLRQARLLLVSSGAHGTHGARGTYKYKGKWGSLDHVMASTTMAERMVDCHVCDMPFLVEDDEKYGGIQPRRTYVGRRYHRGTSDHLPLVAHFDLSPR